jgi:hypothetical protein
MTWAQPRARALLPDVMLAAAWVVALTLVDVRAFRDVMLVAIPIVVAWGVVTLHMPTRVDVDEAGVAFHAYGRTHRFAWTDVTGVRARRFLMRDRVLVRLDPSGPWRGRYWIVGDPDDVARVVAAIESRGRDQGPARSAAGTPNT